MTGVRFLLDTNILSEPLKPQPNPLVIQRLTDNSEALATASIAYYELQFGCYRLPNSRKRRVLEVYLQEEVEAKLVILPYDLDAARWHASERSRLVRSGRTPPYVDGQIAAIAAVHDLVLVTNNTANYQDFQSLQLENWFLP
ncbi:MAG: type II toxin-antitoxin system VapC family toxin [Cyanobacteriota bacterium]